MTTHGDLALENYTCASRAPSNAWRVTMYFYAGVHAVNHAIFGRGYAPPHYRHKERRTWINARWGLVDSVTYTDLEEVSRIARYYAADHPIDDQLVRDAKKNCEDVLKVVGLAVPAVATPAPTPVQQGGS